MSQPIFLPQLPQVRQTPADGLSRVVEFGEPVGGGHTELHVLSSVWVRGWQFERCSCGWTAEVFNGQRPVCCAVEDALADFQHACEVLFEKNVARAIRDGQREEAHLNRLLGIV